MTTLPEVIAASRVVLLDFDGPTCHLFAGRPAQGIAAELRRYLDSIGLPTEGADPHDPLALYAAAIANDPDRADEVEAWLSAAEADAAALAEATPGCGDMLDAACAAGLPVVIVSNNSETAIRAYLNRGLVGGHVAGIVGRPYAAPERMKPSPWPIREAAQRQQVPPSSAVLIGDSLTDIEAAHAAGVPCIGYANKPGKRERFRDARASVIVDDMHAIADAIRRSAETEKVTR